MFRVVSRLVNILRIFLLYCLPYIKTLHLALKLTTSPNNIFHNKLKPKLPLCLIKHKAMQAHGGGGRGRGSGLITIWILTSGCYMEMNDQATPLPDKTDHRYRPDRRPGGPNQSIWVFWRKELSLASPRNRGRDISVGIAARYGLQGPGIESRWRRDFPPLSRPALGSTQPPVQ